MITKILTWLLGDPKTKIGGYQPLNNISSLPPRGERGVQAK